MTEEPFEQFGGLSTPRLTPRKKSNLIVTRASDVQPERIRWLWQDRIPLGKPTVFAGDGGIGKTMLLIMIAACVSRGRTWPCDEGKAPCGSVVILSAEDDPADTIVPRLIAADADCERVHIVSAVRRDDDKGNRSFDLQTDLQSLEAKLAEIGDVVLVIIDPVSSYLGKGTDSHSNSDVRRVLEPVTKRPKQTDPLAVVRCRHRVFPPSLRTSRSPLTSGRR